MVDGLTIRIHETDHNMHRWDPPCKNDLGLIYVVRPETERETPSDNYAWGFHTGGTPPGSTRLLACITSGTATVTGGRNDSTFQGNVTSA